MLGIFIRTNFNSTIEYKHQSGGTVLGEREQPVWRPEGWTREARGVMAGWPATLYPLPTDKFLFKKNFKNKEYRQHGYMSLFAGAKETTVD